MDFPIEDICMDTYMSRCINLAVRAPLEMRQPLVGALIVNRRGIIIGEGYRHFLAGSKMVVHAERDALGKVQPEDSMGACLFTTLEPCINVRRNQVLCSCSELIVERGIDTVVYGVPDNSPSVSQNAGINYLRDHGINVYRIENEKTKRCIRTRLMR